MHIVFLTRRAWPAVGGVERHLQFLCRALVSNNPDLKISIITESVSATDPTHELHEVVEYYRFPMVPDSVHPNVKKSVLLGMRQFLPIIRSADVIHVHDVFFWLLPILPFIFHKKIFTTFHGYEVPGPPNWRQRFWHHLAEVLSDGNICIGGFHQKWYGVEPTLTSFGAVDLNEKIIPREAKHGAKQKVIFVGRLDHDTGIWSYLQALREAKNFQYQLDIFGDGPLRKPLEKFVNDHQLSVHFHGHQPISVETFAEYDLSLGTGYLAVLESLAAGVPVIATYHSALKKDYFQNSPFAKWIRIVEPGEELAKVLPELHSLSPAARSWARKQTWQKLANQYQELWATHG